MIRKYYDFRGGIDGGSAPADSTPNWYRKDHMIDWLRQQGYSKEIAEELAGHFAEGLQGAYKKGWEMGINKDRGENPYQYFAAPADSQGDKELIDKVEREAELRYPVKTHVDPENSPYKISQITFRHGVQFGLSLQGTGGGVGEYQLCPKCFGDGNLLRYNSPNYYSETPVCDVCKGEKLIQRPALIKTKP